MSQSEAFDVCFNKVNMPLGRSLVDGGLLVRRLETVLRHAEKHELVAVATNVKDAINLVNLAMDVLCDACEASLPPRYGR